MAVVVKLPRLGQGMEAGTIVRWLKSEGEEVAKGEPLYELDTDKVTQEVEADSGGVLLKIVVPDGEVDVGTTIAVIGARDEDVSALLGDGNGSVPVSEPAAASVADGDVPREAAPTPEPVAPAALEPSSKPEAEPATMPTAPPAPRGGGHVKASPLARRIAREQGVDLTALTGTGPEGRIVAEDVERVVKAPARAPTPAVGVDELEVVQLTSVRRTIARRLTEAWEAPVFQLTVTADARALVATRSRLVERLREGPVKPTVNDVLTRLVATALVRHRAVNAHFVDGEIHRYASADVGIAVATPNGLVVPVIRGADRSSIGEIATARADLVARAREGKLQLRDLEGGTFTISNLGMYGIDHFIAVLNPPQVAILAVGSIADRPFAVEGRLEAVASLTMTLTCDHRAIDGSEGAEFLDTVHALVENPALAL